jgi:hypothetical protein
MRLPLQAALVLVLALIVPVPSLHATLVVPDAEFRIQELGIPSGVTIGPINVPLFDAFDVSNAGFQIVGTVSANGGAKPAADIQLSAQCFDCGLVIPAVSATATYYFVVDGPPNVPPRLVPTVIHVRGEVSTSATGFSRAVASARVNFGRLGAGQGLLGIVTASARDDDNFPPAAEFESSRRLNLLSDVAVHFLTFHATGSVNVGDGDSADFQAVADPQVEIDPTFPDRDLYSIRFSAGIGPGDPVAAPVPATLLLMGLAGLGFVGHAWRQRGLARRGAPGTDSMRR